MTILVGDSLPSLIETTLAVALSRARACAATLDATEGLFGVTSKADQSSKINKMLLARKDLETSNVCIDSRSQRGVTQHRLEFLIRCWIMKNFGLHIIRIRGESVAKLVYGVP